MFGRKKKDSRKSAKPTLTASQRLRQDKLKTYTENNARVRAENAKKKAAVNKKALAAKTAKTAAAKKRAAQVAKMKKLTPAQRKAAIAKAGNQTAKQTGYVGPTLPKKQSAARQQRDANEKKLVKTADGMMSPAKARRLKAARLAASSPKAMAKYAKEQKKTMAKTKKVVKPTVKPTVKPSAKTPTYKAPATKQSTAYSKDARNKEYDRLRKAGKTKEAEALGKKISSEMIAKAPKNPFRAPQGAERKDNSYKAVMALKGMGNFNKGLAINPDKGPTFKVKPTPKTVLSADERNRKRRQNNIA
ncbi:hypothetical protein N8654_03195 [Synechococcus sp. AH-601-B19]|nr:hypothetical protein [Synechococcus sp. AH-601-B19]